MNRYFILTVAVILGFIAGALMPVQAAERPAAPAQGSFLPFPRPRRPAWPGRRCRRRSTNAGSRRAGFPRCAQHPHHPARRRRIRAAGHLRRPDPHPDLVENRRRGHQLQRVSHHGNLLADPCGTNDRPQPPPRGLRYDCRARGGLGWVYRRDPAHVGDARQGTRVLRLQERRLRQVAQHARHRDHRDGAVSPTGRPARGLASTTSTASSPARPRSGSRGSSRTSTPSNRLTMRNTT